MNIKSRAEVLRKTNNSIPYVVIALLMLTFINGFLKEYDHQKELRAQAVRYELMLSKLSAQERHDLEQRNEAVLNFCGRKPCRHK